MIIGNLLKFEKILLTYLKKRNRPSIATIEPLRLKAIERSIEPVIKYFILKFLK